MERYGNLQFCSDLSPARWLEEVHAGEHHWLTVAGMCAPGYASYARVLHPARYEQADGTVSGRRWAEVAEANGTQMHPVVMFTDLTTVRGTPLVGQPDVWAYPPANGGPPADVAVRLAETLARYTVRPESCSFGLWEGYGDVRNLIPPQAPRFFLPGRGYVLLHGPLTEVLSCAELPRLPDRWWPADHAWCLGGDVDTMCTYIAGDEQLITALLADPTLEVYRVRAHDNT